MSQDYETSAHESTQVPVWGWRLALAALATTVCAGLGLALLLLGGLADPPRAGPLRWQDDAPAAWPVETSGDMPWHIAPVALPAPPFTLEIDARNGGADTSAWGVWIDSAEGRIDFFIRREGYVSVAPAGALDWRQFIHIRRDDNRLYLHVESARQAVLRINGEAAWRGGLAPSGGWGVMTFGQAQMTWSGARLYAYF